MRHVQDMVEGSTRMAFSGDENDNRMYYIAIEKYNDTGRHVVGLVYEGTSVLLVLVQIKDKDECASCCGRKEKMYTVVELGLWQIKGRERSRGKEDKWK